MMYALNIEGERIEAMPGLIGTCPVCNNELIPKCGEVNAWHWAHRNLEDCDTWAEGETAWHYGWKRIIGKENCEIKIGNHRADIKFHNLVVELQNSPISPNEIREREIYYGNMIWLFNESSDERTTGFRLTAKKSESGKKYITFRWKHPKKSIFSANRPIFFDFGESIFQIRKIFCKTPCRGWGTLISKQEFIGIIKDGAYIWPTKKVLFSNEPICGICGISKAALLLDGPQEYVCVECYNKNGRKLVWPEGAQA